MAIVKQTKSNSSHTLVTFIIAEHEAPSPSNVLLLGDFNKWKSNDSDFLMEKEGGSFVKTIKLENGKRHEFRYLSIDKGWFNDHAADDYVPSPYETIDNSVVDLTDVSKKKKTTAKKVAKKPVKKVVAKATKKAAVKPVKKAVAKPVKKAVVKPVKKAATKAVKKVVAKPVKKAAKDDLKKIEGIGPKIASILTGKGIGTFDKLSKTTAKALENILKEAGPRYTMHKPGSWPKQAKLAKDGKWDKLKELQDKLDGGK